MNSLTGRAWWGQLRGRFLATLYHLDRGAHMERHACPFEPAPHWIRQRFVPVRQDPLAGFDDRNSEPSFQKAVPSSRPI
jgi:hypothetical protein